MVTVDAGTLWLLGLKTEGRATHIAAVNGAKVESLGGVSKKLPRKDVKGFMSLYRSGR